MELRSPRPPALIGPLHGRPQFRTIGVRIRLRVTHAPQNETFEVVGIAQGLSVSCGSGLTTGVRCWLHSNARQLDVPILSDSLHGLIGHIARSPSHGQADRLWMSPRFPTRRLWSGLRTTRSSSSSSSPSSRCHGTELAAQCPSGLNQVHAHGKIRPEAYSAHPGPKTAGQVMNQSTRCDNRHSVMPNPTESHGHVERRQAALERSIQGEGGGFGPTLFLSTRHADAQSPTLNTMAQQMSCRGKVSRCLLSRARGRGIHSM